MSTPFDSDIVAYLAHGRARSWSKHTVRNYQKKLAMVGQFCRRRGCHHAADVTIEDLEALMQSELDAGTALSTRQQLVGLIRNIFRWFHEKGRIMRDPARTLSMPDDGEEVLPAPPLSVSEVKAVFDGLPRRKVTDLRNVCLLELLYGCGLRRSEAVGLDLDDVDLANRTLLVRQGKGGQDRLLPLSATAAVAVRDWLSLRRTLLRGPDHSAFFVGQTGKRFDDASLASVFRLLNARRGPDARSIHPHLFRHSIAVHLLQGGVDIRNIQAFLGHANLDTTKIYLRLVPGRLKEDYEKAMPEISVGLNSQGQAH